MVGPGGKNFLVNPKLKRYSSIEDTMCNRQPKSYLTACHASNSENGVVPRYGRSDLH